MNDILEIIDKNGWLEAAQIAAMLNRDVGEVKNTIDELVSSKILNNKASINWEKTDRELVRAIIELKITPQRGEGFTRVAERVSKFEQVKSVYLMSGAYDLSVLVEGRTMKDVAFFVAEKLAPMESVLSTATHFMLKAYKENGIIFDEDTKDLRQVITL